MNLPDIILMAAWIQLRPAYKYIYGLFDSVHFMSRFQHETFKNNPTNLVSLTFFFCVNVFQFQHDQKKKKNHMIIII